MIEPILSAFCRSSRSLEYVHGKLSKSKDIFDLKGDFKTHLLHRAEIAKGTIKDSYYDAYIKEYKIREHQKKQELMQYASEAAN